MDDMESILNQISLIKKRLNQLENELKEINLRADDNQGMVTVIVNGKGKLLDFNLHNDELKDLTKDAIIEAVNKALKKAKQTRADKKQEIVGDVNLPDIPGLF